MIIIPFKSEAKFDNLSEIAQERALKGGRVILYKYAWSAISIAFLKSELVLVLPHESRIRKGFSRSVRTLLLGWWSFSGTFYTAAALVHNLSGGLDVTHIYGGLPPPPPGTKEEAAFSSKLAAEMSLIKKRTRPFAFIAPIFTIAMIALFIWVVTHIASH